MIGLAGSHADLGSGSPTGLNAAAGPAWVAFTPARLRFPLFGFAGCLQFFTAMFDGEREHVTLAANARYPGG